MESLLVLHGINLLKADVTGVNRELLCRLAVMFLMHKMISLKTRHCFQLRLMSVFSSDIATQSNRRNLRSRNRGSVKQSFCRGVSTQPGS